MQVFIKLAVHFASLNCLCQCTTFPLPLLSAFGAAGGAVSFTVAKLISIILVCKCFGYFNYNLTYRSYKSLILNTYLQKFTLALIVGNFRIYAFMYKCLIHKILSIIVANISVK